MASTSNSSAEFELDDLNLALDTVTFDDIQDHNAPDQDIFVVYSVNESFKPSSRDWIGLYTQDWEHPRDYLTFQWAQKQPRDPKFKFLRSILLQTKNLNLAPSGNVYYQLLYVTKQNDVVGASKRFRIHHYCPSEEEAAFVCVERPMTDLGIGSLTFIETDTNKPKGLLETFELIKSSSEPTSFERPAVKKSYDNATLASSFDNAPRRDMLDVRPSMDPLLQEYLANKERALVPMAARDVIPFKSSYKPLYTICNNGKDTGVDLEALITPIATKFFKTANVKVLGSTSNRKVTPKFSIGMKTSKGSAVRASSHRLFSAARVKATSKTCTEKGDCTDCKKKVIRIKAIRSKMAKLEKEASILKEELTANQETLDMKDVLLDEVTNKVKDLVQENDQLVAANDQLFSDKHRLRAVISENKRLVMNKTKLGKRYQKISDENQSLAGELENLSNSVCEKETAANTLTSRNTYLEGEMSLLKGQQEELEKFLDDILYTLSLQGYNRLVDAAGKVTDLTKKKGSVLELHGWSMKNSKKIERHLATIAHHETTIVELQVESERLRMLIRENDRQLQAEAKCHKEEAGKVVELQNELEDAQVKLSASAEREESLSRLLMNEKRQKLEMIKKYQDNEKVLKAKLSAMKVNRAGQTARGTMCNSGTQAMQASSTSGTQTTDKLRDRLTDASESLTKMCNYVTSNILSATQAASASAETSRVTPRSEDTGRVHSSKRRGAAGGAASRDSLSKVDPAVLSWTEEVELEEVVVDDVARPSSSRVKSRKAVVTEAPRVKKSKVFGTKAKRPRKFMLQERAPGKGRPTSAHEYTPAVFGPKPAPFK